MKHIAIALFATAAALAAPTAHADTRVSVGVNVGAPVYHPVPPPVVYTPAPSVVVAPPPAVVVEPARGYWKDVQVRTWVPERWVVRTNRWGRTERFCEPGYYTYTTQRVWVDARADHGRGYAYGHRDYGYGYDGRNDHDYRWNR